MLNIENGNNEKKKTESDPLETLKILDNTEINTKTWMEDTK
jgi:hypothetical protein